MTPTLPGRTVGILGGLSHIFLTESYRYASAATVARTA